MQTLSSAILDGTTSSYRREQGNGEVMRRVGLALLLAIALLAGFTVRAVWYQPPFSSGIVVGGPADTTTATTFYDSLNVALAGGSIEPLEGLLSDLFRDHDPDTGVSQTAGEFLADVRAMNAVPQGIRLVVTSMEVSGANLLVGIEPVRSGVLQVVGITVEASLPVRHFETLRIEDGQIIDRWALPIPWIEAVEDPGAAFSVSSMAQITSALVRVEISGWSELTWRTASADIVMIEAGTVHLSRSRGTTQYPPVVLEKGEFMTLEAGSRVRMRSADGADIRALVVTTELAGAAYITHPTFSMAAIAQGVSQSVLWSGPLSEAGASNRYRAGTFVLPPYAKIELSDTQGIRMLLGIESGEVEVRSPGNTVTVLSEDRRPEEHPGTVQLDADHAGAITGVNPAMLRNLTDHPVAIFILAIEGSTDAA